MISLDHRHLLSLPKVYSSYWMQFLVVVVVVVLIAAAAAAAVVEEVKAVLN